MTTSPAPPDLDGDADEIERLQAQAADRTSKPRAAYTEILTARALARAVDPNNGLALDERQARMRGLALTLGPDGVAELVKAERSEVMSALARKSAQARRGRRLDRLRQVVLGIAGASAVTA